MSWSKFTWVCALLGVAQAVLLCAAATHAQPEPEIGGVTDSPWQITKRLATDVIPTHYNVSLRPNLEAGNFIGYVSIIVQLVAPKKSIFLHMKNLNITMYELLRLDTSKFVDNNDTENAANVFIAKLVVFKHNEFLVLLLNTTTAIGRYAINIWFRGSMTNKLAGFYRSSYINNKNQTQYLAVTQFGPTYARQAFPCFDEPSYKATFNIAVLHPANLFALSNMPVREALSDGKLTLTGFAKTPPMSTYLVAVVVSDFKNYFELNSSKSGVRLRIYAAPQQIDKLRDATTVLWHAVKAFEEYFDIPFALPKLDVIAIPDFGTGAMENWGLIIVRDKNLLVGAGNAAQLISHEVAHQWFGNLVTMNWWDALWLSEGFATRMEYVGLRDAYASADYPLSELFVTVECHPALLADQLRSSHPIVVAGVQDPADIAALPDTITYSKSACVLRMLEEVMGAETFRKGVSRYLRKHSFGSATTDDMWRALNEELALNCTAASPTNEKCSMDVKKVMDTWTLQTNYPVVNVQSINATHGRLTQKRFLSDGDETKKAVVLATNESYMSPYNYTWYIPITFRPLDSNVTHLVWTNSHEVTFKWPTTNKTTKQSPKLGNDSSSHSFPHMVKFNPTQAGFYRVNYPLSIWAKLANLLSINPTFLLPDARDRFGLVNDAFHLAKANMVPYTVPLDFLPFLAREHTDTVWSAAVHEIHYIGLRLRAIPKAYELYRAFIRELVKPALREEGCSLNCTYEEVNLRYTLLNLACQSGEVDCIRFVRKSFKDFLFRNKDIQQPTLQLLVSKYGMVYNDDERVWQILLDRLQVSRSPLETTKLLTALYSTTKPEQIQQFLQLSFNNSYVRTHDQALVIARMALNPAATTYVWNFYRTRLPELIDRLTLNNQLLGQIPLIFAIKFDNQSQLDEMKALFEKYPEAGAGKLDRRQAVETIENNISWLAKNNATVIAWLRNQKQQRTKAAVSGIINYR